MRISPKSPGWGVPSAKPAIYVFPVDVLRLGRQAAFPEQFRFLGRSHDQDREAFADEGLISLSGNLALQRHQPPFAVVDRAAIHFAAEMIAFACLVVGVAEYANAVKLSSLDELAQLFEVFAGFSGESNDETRSNGDSRNGFFESSRLAPGKCLPTRRVSCA